MAALTQKNVTDPAAPASPVIELKKGRGIEAFEKLTLFVNAGGRCELFCNTYLLEHHVTLTPGMFAEMAHIVAFRPDGPRGDVPLPREYINDVSNLMVLCPGCHKLIDDHPDEYSVERLRKRKEAHEERIRRLTGIAPQLKTTVLQFTARVKDRTTVIPFEYIARAIKPRYATDHKGVVVDLTTISASGAEFVSVACAEIRGAAAQLSAIGLDREQVAHVSLFAIAPMPLLVFLGREISDKVELDLFQRHRDTEDWSWKTTGAPVAYTFDVIRQGTDPHRAALVLSLSGKIALSSLPGAIDESFTVYQMTLSGMEPTPVFLNTRADIAAFKIAYQRALRTVGAAHPGIAELHLFPAVPAPIAVLCGRELLPKVDPRLLVYDADKANGGFTLVLTVN